MSKVTPAETIADRLNFLFAEKGFSSLRAAALDIGIPPRTLHAIVNRKAISKSTAKLIQHSWGVNPEWLMHGKGPIYCDPDDVSAPINMLKNEHLFETSEFANYEPRLILIQMSTLHE
jgi:hypothetical protein